MPRSTGCGTSEEGHAVNDRSWYERSAGRIWRPAMFFRCREIISPRKWLSAPLNCTMSGLLA